MLPNMRKRIEQYWFEDGLAEIFIGVIGLMLAVMFAVQQAVVEKTWGNLLFVPLVFAIAYAIRFLMLRVKESSTYPRTGYVAYKSRWSKRGWLIITVVFTLVVAVLNYLIIRNSPYGVVWTPAVCGLILAFIFGMAGYQTGLPRLTLFAIFCLFGGIALSFSGVGDLFGAAVLSALMGVVLLISGGVTRRGYLRRNPLPRS